MNRNFYTLILIVLWALLPPLLAIMSHVSLSDARAVRAGHGLPVGDLWPLWVYGAMAYLAFAPMFVSFALQIIKGRK